MDEPILDHIAAMAAGRDVGLLLRAAGCVDRTHPVSRDWVRRWGPVRSDGTALPDCSCALGRCVVCN